MLYFQAKKKELKSEKKKKNCNRAKPMASPTDYRGNKQMDSRKKKKKKKNPNTEQITKSETKPTVTSLIEQTKPQYIGVYQKKETQYRKPNPNTNQTKPMVTLLVAHSSSSSTLTRPSLLLLDARLSS